MALPDDRRGRGASSTARKALLGAAAVLAVASAAVALSLGAFGDLNPQKEAEARQDKAGNQLADASSAPLPAGKAAPLPTAESTPPLSPPVQEAPDLARYAGLYPIDPVDGVRFTDHPAVASTVHAAVSDPAIRSRVLDSNATAGPIDVGPGQVLLWACESHNCGPHNWSIIVDRSGETADVCYYVEEAGEARWFRQGREIAPESADGCPHDLSEL